MTYRIKKRVPNSLIFQSHISEERIYRDIAQGFIDELPIEVVKHIFNLQRRTPSKENIRMAVKDGNMELLNHLLSLKDVSEFTGRINVSLNELDK